MTSNPIASRLAAGVAILCTLLVGLLFGVSSVMAAESFCPPGSGAGQCSEPYGVAVQEESGQVYVVDRGNHRVNVFDATGGFQFSFGSAQLENPTNIAIDNDAVSAFYRNVYVIDSFHVVKFDREGNFLGQFGSQGAGSGQFSSASNPVTIGPGGTVNVCDSQPLAGENKAAPSVEEFEPSGAFLKSVPLGGTERACRSVAADSTGAFYLTTNDPSLGVLKYDLSGNLLYTLDAGTQAYALAVDASDGIFSLQLPFDSPPFLTRWNASGTKLSSFGYGEIDVFLSYGLAVYSATSELFIGESDRVVRIPPAPPGPLVSSPSVIADPIGNAKATLNAEINPEGKVTTYHFDYITDTQYQADGNSFGAGTTSTPESASIGSDFELHLATAVVGCPNPLVEAGEVGNTCLIPETKYRFRIIARDSEGNEAQVEGTPFTTRPSLEVLATFATEVGTDSAKLHAEINPLGIPATGRFEYVEDAKYLENGFVQANAGTTLDFGSGESAAQRSALFSGLSPGTTYHYRVLADDPLIEPLPGPERTFTTQAPPPAPPSPDPCPNAQFRTGASANLPECRAYEMVSPLDKDNGDIAVSVSDVGYPAQLDQAAVAGGKLTYSSYKAFGDPRAAPYISQYLASRDPEAGWQSQAISPPRGINITGISVSLDTEFKAFSPDLCSGWLIHDTDPPLAAGAIEGFTNLYKDDLCGEAGFEALSTVAPPHREPYAFWIEAQGASADGATTIFRANDVLTGNAPSIEKLLLYGSRNGGKPKLICILPGGTPIGPLGCSAGTGDAEALGEGRTAGVSHAISSDGSRVFWSASAQAPGALYVRENPFGGGAECGSATAPCTVAISGPVTSQPASEPARFWTAAADGSTAIFGIIEGSHAGDLYEFDVEAKEAHLIAHEVAGVLGASEDASHVYFVSNEATAQEEAEGAQEGKPNLYLYQAAEGGGGSSFSFIATLSQADANAVLATKPSLVHPRPIMHLARVSPDGRHLVFMSSAPLLSYDNTDASNGKADNEIYTYEAGGQLFCVSCNPTGARPVGSELLRFAHQTDIWAAAQIPAAENQLYAPRVLSDDGRRLFFESTDALLARDTNGHQDVYEWLRSGGEGECEEAGAELYVAKAGGCLSLISSGQSPRDSEFVDSSADGTDVFIATGASLLPQDPGLIDIYDARAEGGFPPPPVPPAACEGEACQGPPAPPNDPTPASSSFQGAGNVSASGGAKASCRRPKIRRKGRCVAKKQRKQAKHERRAAR